MAGNLLDGLAMATRKHGRNFAMESFFLLFFERLKEPEMKRPVSEEDEAPFFAQGSIGKERVQVEPQLGGVRLEQGFEQVQRCRPAKDSQRF